MRYPLLIVTGLLTYFAFMPGIPQNPWQAEYMSHKEYCQKISPNSGFPDPTAQSWLESVIKRVHSSQEFFWNQTPTLVQLRFLPRPHRYHLANKIDWLKDEILNLQDRQNPLSLKTQQEPDKVGDAIHRKYKMISRLKAWNLTPFELLELEESHFEATHEEPESFNEPMGLIVQFGSLLHPNLRVYLGQKQTNGTWQIISQGHFLELPAKRLPEGFTHASHGERLMEAMELYQRLFSNSHLHIQSTPVKWLSKRTLVIEGETSKPLAQSFQLLLGLTDSACLIDTEWTTALLKKLKTKKLKALREPSADAPAKVFQLMQNLNAENNLQKRRFTLLPSLAN